MRFRLGNLGIVSQCSSRCLPSRALFREPHLQSRAIEYLGANLQQVRGAVRVSEHDASVNVNDQQKERGYLWPLDSKAITYSVARPTQFQGVLPNPDIDTPITVDEGPTYPTVMQQALNNMRKFSHCVLLTRVGSFYEV
jgi:hypothetical protein